MIKERVIENTLLSWLAYKRIFAFKVDNQGFYNHKKQCFMKRSIHRVLGVPDIIAIHQGKAYGIEVKTPRGRVSEHQKNFHEKWAENGGIIVIARCIEDLEAVFCKAS